MANTTTMASARLDAEVPCLTTNALVTLQARYLDRDENGFVETPADLFRRVARTVAEASGPAAAAADESRFYQLMVQGQFMPNSPTLMNAGRKLNMLSACFVLPVPDSTDEIFDSVKRVAIIQKAGGGTGMAFDQLRPCGSFVSTSGGKSSGPISFWRVFSEATRAIQQGSFRRGANMAIMSIDHPDIIKFIFAKQDLRQFVNYNISLKVPDRFMYDLEVSGDSPVVVKWKDKQWHIPRTIVDVCREASERGRTNADDPSRLDTCYGVQDLREVNPDLPDPTDCLTHRELFRLVVQHAWQTGEPGLFFIDRVRETEALPNTAPIHATNPCVVGDTALLTLDGVKTFQELYDSGKTSVLVHAWDPDSKLPVVRMMRNIRKTGTNVPVVEIEFDSGLKVRCTPGHKFRSFRGNKVAAESLRVGQSVRAYAVSRHRDGHQRAHAWVANRCAHQWVHRMVADCFDIDIPEGYVVDHIDEDPNNNNPDNFRIVTPEEHNRIHYASRSSKGFGRAGWKTPVEEVNAHISQGVRRHYAALNHKVVAIRDAGLADVFNGTVDDVHTYVIADPEYRGDSESGLWSGIVSCNCGEEPLPAYGSCNLGSINVGAFVKPFWEVPGGLRVPLETRLNAQVDWQSMHACIRDSARFLDNVVSANKYPTPEIQEQATKERRIGLGVMGFADMLIKLGVRYDSEEALAIADKLMRFVNENAIWTSEKLAAERGSFPAFPDNVRWKRPMRNVCVTSIAPTGTISIIANCSCGIEPLFSFAFYRQILEDAKGERKQMKQLHEGFLTVAEEGGFLTDALVERVLDTGTVQDIEEVPAEIRDIFRSAMDIAPEWHVRMQAAFQAHCTSAVSKTINLPASATVKDVEDAYVLGYRMRVKGITVYRDGCREAQPMSLKKSLTTAEPQAEIFKFAEPHKVTGILPAIRTVYKSTYGSLHIHITLEALPDGRYRELEVFFQAGYSGDGVNGIVEGFGRLISTLLKIKAPIHLPVEQLAGIATHGQKRNAQTGEMSSIPNELAMGLLSYMQSVDDLRDSDGCLRALPSSFWPNMTPAKRNGNGQHTHDFIKKTISRAAQAGLSRIPCPTTGCAGFLVYTEGCRKCLTCGEGSC